MTDDALRSLRDAIHQVTGKQISGQYRRYKSKKWQYLGDSGVPTPDGGDTYLLFAANFTDKHQIAYRFLVTVDINAETVTPVEEHDEQTQEWLADATELISFPQNDRGPEETGQTQSRQIWLAEVANDRFPRHKDPDRPQLIIGLCKGDPIGHIEALNKKNEQKSRFAQIFPYRPRMDLLEALPKSVRGEESYTNLESLKARRRKIREYFEDNGRVIQGQPNESVYTVYVVNLKDATGTRKNPKPWVYVGQTILSPQERLKQHFAGHKASKWVNKYGVDLDRELMRGVPQTRFRQDALHVEAQHAIDLEAAGFNVKGGH